MHSTGFLACVLIGGAGLALSGCSRTPPTAEGASSTPPSVQTTQPVAGDWVVQVIGADPDSLNPITGQDATGAMIRSPAIFESMLQMDHVTLKLKPWLAESYEISSDQLIYTFHLRHDVKWQDGVPMTAEDVKYSFDRVIDPKVDAADKSVYFTNIKSCVVLDPYTIRFTSTERYFKTLEVLGTTDTLPIVPKHLLTVGEHDFNKHPFGRAPVGTGPYKFVRWDTGSQIVLERDDHYWGGPGHYPKRLVYQIIQEPYVSAQLLKKGEVDVIDGMPPLQWERELAHSRSISHINKVVYDYPAYSYLGFNLREPLFKDVRVRHAIDLLIPRDKIISLVYLNQYAKPTEGYDMPSSPNYNHDIPITPYDPSAALKLLHEAGWQLGDDGLLHKDGQALSFTLFYPSAGSANGNKSLELIQEALRNAGIEMKITGLEWAQLLTRLNDWKFQAMIGAWALDVNGDPSQLWSSSQATIKKSSNFIGYANPAADKLIEAGKLEYDDAKRAAIYRQLQKVIHDDYPVCFLFNPRTIMLVNNRFQDVRLFAPRPCFDLTTWWVPVPLQKYH
jgi:peptide/nickel transport system substrate-binding protein